MDMYLAGVMGFSPTQSTRNYWRYIILADKIMLLQHWCGEYDSIVKGNNGYVDYVLFLQLVYMPF